MPQIIHLTDHNSGAEASVAPELGFNCFHFAVPHQGKPLDVLWAAPNFAAGTERPSGTGIPILFPFPGRIRGTSFDWEGKTYALEEGDGCGNAIHGYALRRAWRVIEQTPSSVTGEFQASVDDPTLAHRWPGDFRIRATYTLAGHSLRGSYHLQNMGSQSMPFGFATHAYYRVPLGGPAADDCRITVPVTEKWEHFQMHLTGEHNGLPPEGRLTGLRFGEAKFDNVFSGWTPDGDTLRATISDPHSGVTVTQSCPTNCPYCVVYTPPHRQAICLEPYTCVPDAFRLAHAGVEAGQRILPAGGEFRTTLEIAVSGVK